MREALSIVLVSTLLFACDGDREAASHLIPDADAERGGRLIAMAGCGACHEIPGIVAARGIVGPSLRTFARRVTIGGVLANRAGNLMDWIRDAPRIAPGTAMPAFDFNEREAADIAAYLYTLR